MSDGGYEWPSEKSYTKAELYAQIAALTSANTDNVLLLQIREQELKISSLQREVEMLEERKQASIEYADKINAENATLRAQNESACLLSRVCLLQMEQKQKTIETFKGLMSEREKLTVSLQAQLERQQRAVTDRPQIVCLCGSTRFKETFIQAYADETDKGYIVLSVGRFVPQAEQVLGIEKKAALDELHKRKIDLADEVLVLNVDGYIGSSTRSEIDYAIAHGKRVRYREPLASRAGEPQEGEGK